MNQSGSLHPPLFAEFPPVSREEWEAAIRADLKGADYQRKLIRETFEGVTIRPYYRADDIASLSSQPEQLARLLPGPARGHRWEVCQAVSAADPASAASAARAAVSGGAQAIALYCDAATAGPGGALLRDSDTFQQLLGGLPEGDYRLHIRAGLTAKAAAALLLNSTAPFLSTHGGTLDFDPLSAAARTGIAPDSALPPGPELAALVRAFRSHAPRFRPLCIDVGYLGRAGGSLTQELAVALAAAVEYLTLLLDEGLTLDQIASSLFFSCEIGSDYFLEIARFRAWRLLWDSVWRGFPGAPSPAVTVPIHARTARRNKSILDPHVNILRATTEAMSAVLGGCDVVEVGPFDEPAGAPGELAVRLARNTQIILDQEAYLSKVADPAAGSYYLEWLTDALAREAWRLFQAIEARGGLRAALSDGWLHGEVGSVRAKREIRFASRRDVMVGVNSYPPPAAPPQPGPEPAGSAASFSSYPTRLLAPPASLSALREAFSHPATLDSFLQPLSAQAHSFPAFAPLEVPAAAPFEQVRYATQLHYRVSGRLPVVFLFTDGDVAWRNARAQFARNLLGCAGFLIEENSYPDDRSAALDQMRRCDADIVVLCSADHAYADLAAAVGEPFKRSKPHGVLIVAGNPQETAAELRALGAEEFLHVRANALEALRNLQQRLGIHFPEARP